MRNLKDYLNRIDLALKKLEENKVLIKEAQEIKELKKKFGIWNYKT